LIPTVKSAISGADDAATERRGGAVSGALLALGQDSFVYLLGAAALGLGNFLLIPLYTRYLSPAEFGVYALIDVTLMVLIAASLLKLDVSYLKWYADVEPAARPRLMGSVLVAGIAASTLTGAVLSLALTAPFGQEWLGTQERSFIWTLLPIAVLENLQGLLLTNLRARRQSVAYAACSVARLFAIVGCTLWFLVAGRQGLYGVFLGRLAGDAVSVLLLAWSSRGSVTFSLDRTLLRPMIGYGLPLIWASLMMLLMDASGRYFLSTYSTLEQVGLYGAAIKIAGVFQLLLSQPFGIAWGGLMFQIARWPDARRVYSRILSGVVIISLAGSLLVALFTPTLFSLLASPAYVPAMAVFPLVLLVRAAGVMEYPVSTGIAVVSRTGWIAVVSSIGLGVTVCANYLLVPAHGMFGAAAAWLLGAFTDIAFLGILGQRYYPLDIPWKLLLLAFAPWIGIVLEYEWFIQWVSTMGWTLRIGVAAALLGGSAAMLASNFGGRAEAHAR
jgi:O-antigen/teichoic acid export membrane protein